MRTFISRRGERALTGGALLLLAVPLVALAQNNTPASVRFLTSDTLEFRSAASEQSSRRLMPGAVVLVSEDPRTSDRYVEVHTPDGAAGWVLSDRIKLDLDEQTIAEK